jgi:hypothetical protein
MELEIFFTLSKMNKSHKDEYLMFSIIPIVHTFYMNVHC